MPKKQPVLSLKKRQKNAKKMTFFHPQKGSVYDLEEKVQPLFRSCPTTVPNSEIALKRYKTGYILKKGGGRR